MPPVSNGIPVVKSDRGGEITYHGPGQVVLYALVDLARRGIKVKRFVCAARAGGDRPARRRAAERRPGAPGVYVDGAKIAALGIRVARGRAIMASRSTSTWTFRPSPRSIPAAIPALR